MGHLSGLDVETLACKSTWLLFTDHRNPTVVSDTQLRCRQLFRGPVVELEGNVRDREGPPPPPQVQRRQNLEMNGIVPCILRVLLPGLIPCVTPASHGCRVGTSVPPGNVGHFPARRRKDRLPEKSHPTSGGLTTTWLG